MEYRDVSEWQDVRLRSHGPRVQEWKVQSGREVLIFVQKLDSTQSNEVSLHFVRSVTISENYYCILTKSNEIIR